MAYTVKQCPNCDVFSKLGAFHDDEDVKKFFKNFIMFPNKQKICYREDIENNRCPFCKSELIDTKILQDDFYSIFRASNGNRELLLAMIELRQKDVIEFETKMQIFREEYRKIRQERDVNQQNNNDNIPKCPTCGSTKLSKISTVSKAGSVFLFGLLSQKVKKTWHCDNCKYEW